MSSKIQHVLVVGAGTIGTEIAAKCRVAGLTVSVFDTNARALQNLERRDELWRLDSRPPEELEALTEAARELVIETDPRKAVVGVDLLIEAVPEDLALKRDVFRQFGELCDPKTIFVTNTSGLMPSQMAMFSGRPERFAALHFMLAGPLVEIMGQFKTAPEVIESLEEFCQSIGHVPIKCLREFPGYISNALLFPLAQAAMRLVICGASSIQDIDRCFMTSYRAPFGPFGYLDFVGLDTARSVLEQHAKTVRDATLPKMIELLDGYLAKGHRGLKDLKGFYDYPDPEFASDGFLLAQANGQPQPASSHNDRAVPWSIRSSVNREGDDAATVTYSLAADDCVFLREHRAKNVPLLPIAAFVELVRDALEVVFPERTDVAIRDLRILGPLKFFSERAEQVYVQVMPTSNGVACEVTYDFHSRAGKLIQPGRSLLTCRATFDDADTLVVPEHLGSADDQAFRIGYFNDPTIALFIGAPMRCLTDVVYGPDSGRGQLIAKPGDEGDRVHERAVALLDSTIVTNGIHTQFLRYDYYQIPQTIGAITFGRRSRAGEECEAQFVVNESNDEVVASDFVVRGDNGDVILMMNDCRCKPMQSEAGPTTTLNPIDVAAYAT